MPKYSLVLPLNTMGVWLFDMFNPLDNLGQLFLIIDKEDVVIREI